jgi:ATP-dependent DNA helicase RecG
VRHGDPRLGCCQGAGQGRVGVAVHEDEGGLLAVGINNDGTITGCSGRAQKSLNDLEAAGRVYCPDARYESKRVPVTRSDGRADFVVLFRVYYRPDKVVTTVRGNAYIRIADQKHKLNDEEVRELQRDKGQIATEQEPCDRVAYPRDFDATLLREYVLNVRKERRLGADLSDEEVLELRHLGRMDGTVFRPNSACVLLFARDPGAEFPGSKIRFFRFDGETERTGEHFNAVKDETIEGPLPIQIREIERLLDGQLREFARLEPDGKFYSAPEYPGLAWYEAIVNACVHRSYGLRNMNIFVKMFDDRLVIESPGPFPPTVTPENIYNVHNPRNPHLMDAMFYLKFVKCAYEGARRIRDTMAEMNLPGPEFREKQGDVGHALVRVTLRNNIRQRKVWIDSDAAALVGEAIFATLTPDEKRALNFAVEHGAVTVTQVQRHTARTWTTARAPSPRQRSGSRSRTSPRRSSG